MLNVPYTIQNSQSTNTSFNFNSHLKYKKYSGEITMWNSLLLEILLIKKCKILWPIFRKKFISTMLSLKRKRRRKREIPNLREVKGQPLMLQNFPHFMNLSQMEVKKNIFKACCNMKKDYMNYR